MKELVALQRAFQAYLLNPGEQMQGQVVDTPQLRAQERLEIYAEAYRLRLTEALETDFPALHTLLGDAEFHKLCLAYIDAHPSRHFSLRWFGQHLSDFLAVEPPYAEHPVLSEMAAFEWALGEALDASDAPRLSMAELAQIPPEQWPGLRFALHPSVRRLDLAWNVPQLWKAIEEESPPQSPQRIDPPQAWVIWRRQLASFYYSLEPPEAWALDAVQQGGSFAELCEGLCQWLAEEQVALHAASLLHSWLEQGLISALVQD